VSAARVNLWSLFVHRQQLAAKQIKLEAEDYKGPEHWPESRAVVAPEIGNGLEVGLGASQEPDHLHIAVRLGFQAPARAHPVQVAVDVEPQQVGRIIARSAGGLTRAKPAAAKSSSSTNASMKRTGLSGPT